MRNIDMAALDAMTVQGIADLGAAVLCDLDVELSYFESLASKRRAKHKAALELRYSKVFEGVRAASQKATGVIYVPDGEYDIACDLPKKVEWDQRKLAIAFASLSKEVANIYRKAVLSVPEKLFEGAPEKVRLALEQARTVKAGAAKITIKRRDAA